MPLTYPSHLYIRVDRELRSALAGGAQATGETVSAFVRRQLRAAVGVGVQGSAAPSLNASTVSLDRSDV